MLRLPLLALCALLLAVLPGCDSAEDDGSFDGSLVVAGGSSALSGDAYYTELRNGAASTFVLFLTPNDLEDFEDPEFENLTAVVFSREGSRPTVGEYPIFDPEDGGETTAFYFNSPSQQASITMVAESGSLRIDEVNDDGNLEGFFTISGELFDPALPNGSATASVTGSFEAARIVESDLPDLSNSLPRPTR